MLDFKEKIDYTYITGTETNPGIKILSGEFEGVSYMYSNVSISEESEDADPETSSAVLSFNFDVLDYGGYTQEEFETIDFRDKIGNILLSILHKCLENYESKSVNTEEPTLL